MLSFICLVLYLRWAYFTKFTNPRMYVFSPRKHFKPLLCNLTHRMILFNSGLQKLCNPAIPDGRGVSKENIENIEKLEEMENISQMT